MQHYPVRPSHRGNLSPEAIERIAREHFEGITVAPEGVVASFGAISRIVVSAAGRELTVEVTMNPKVPEGIARETIGRYNRFLEQVTGYSAKERAKRLRKSSTAPGSGE